MRVYDHCIKHAKALRRSVTSHDKTVSLVFPESTDNTFVCKATHIILGLPLQVEDPQNLEQLPLRGINNERRLYNVEITSVPQSLV